MISIRQIKEIVERELSYKPGCVLEVIVDERDRDPRSARLSIGFLVDDSTDTGEKIRVDHSYTLLAGALRDREDVIRWVLDKLDEAEHHETREWFKVNGSAPFHPHKEEGTYANG